MKYFGIIDKNVAAIFQLQWKIGNVSDMFLQYSVLYGFVRLLATLYFSTISQANGVSCKINPCSDTNTL